MGGSRHALRTIWFESELLPDWAHLLDLAARLAAVSTETRIWFSRFTQRSGVDDARTVAAHCEVLQHGLREHRDEIIRGLEDGSLDSDAPKIFEAWLYALETMLQQASTLQTCNWRVDAGQDTAGGEFGDGDITLRRV